MDTDLFDVMRTCRAMRRYEARDVPQEVVDELLDLAIRAPSSSNSQNWSFVVVRDSTVKHALAEEVRRGTRWKASLDELRIAGAARRGLVDANEASRMRRAVAAFRRLAEHFENIPVVICVCVEGGNDAMPGVGRSVILRRAVADYGVMGAARFMLAARRSINQGRWATSYPAVQNLLLAARAKGLGAVLTTPHLIGPPGRIEGVLALPKSVGLAAVVPIGYPKGKFGPVRRLPAKVYRNRYGRV